MAEAMSRGTPQRRATPCSAHACHKHTGGGGEGDYRALGSFSLNKILKESFKTAVLSLNYIVFVCQNIKISLQYNTFQCFSLKSLKSIVLSLKCIVFLCQNIKISLQYNTFQCFSKKSFKSVVMSLNYIVFVFKNNQISLQYNSFQCVSLKSFKNL